jgi:hypothetical protein
MSPCSESSPCASGQPELRTQLLVTPMCWCLTQQICRLGCRLCFFKHQVLWVPRVSALTLRVAAGAPGCSTDGSGRAQTESMADSLQTTRSWPQTFCAALKNHQLKNSKGQDGREHLQASPRSGTQAMHCHLSTCFSSIPASDRLRWRASYSRSNSPPTDEPAS